MFSMRCRIVVQAGEHGGGADVSGVSRALLRPAHASLLAQHLQEVSAGHSRQQNAQKEKQEGLR